MQKQPPIERVPSFMLQNMIKELDLTPYDFAVYLFLVGHTNHQKNNLHSGWAWPTQDAIAYYCNMSLWQVNKSIKSLSEKGIITHTEKMISDNGIVARNNKYRVLGPSELYSNKAFIDKIKVEASKKKRTKKLVEKKQQETLNKAKKIINSGGEEWKE